MSLNILYFLKKKKRNPALALIAMLDLHSTPTTLMREWNWLAVSLWPDNSQYCRYGQYESCDDTANFFLRTLFVSLIGLGAQLKWTGDSMSRS